MGIIGDGQTFLDALARPDRAALYAAGRNTVYHRGQILMRQGDPGDFAVAILTGWVTVHLENSNGGRVILALRGGGDLVGDLAVIDGNPRMATVTALDEVEAVVITAAAFHAFLATRPRAATLALSCLGSRLRASDGERMSMATATVIQRLAAYLGELIEHAGARTVRGVAVDLHMSQQEIAAAVGATREAVAKALRILREKGVISTMSQPIEVLDLPALRAISAGHEPGAGRRTLRPPESRRAA
jgi:CRP-like cAMP-binding protein